MSDPPNKHLPVPPPSSSSSASVQATLQSSSSLMSRQLSNGSPDLSEEDDWEDPEAPEVKGELLIMMMTFTNDLK